MINLAIIGTGTIAKAHIEACLTFPNLCHLTALINRTRQKARDYIRTYELTDTAVYASLDQAIEDQARLGKRIDAVAICLPAELHASAAIDAMEKGCHVLVEKPMANSSADCQTMIDASVRTQKMLSVAFQYRYTRENRLLHDVIKSGEFGQVRHAVIDSCWWRGNNYYNTPWRGKWETEHGGVFLGHAIHQIDLLLWILGKPTSVLASMRNVAHPTSELEDLGCAILNYPTGLVILNASLVEHGQKVAMSFQLDRAKVSSPWDPQAYREDETGFPQIDQAVIQRLNAIRESAGRKSALEAEDWRYEHHKGLYYHFLRAVNGLEDLQITGEDGKAAIELVEEIYKEAKKVPIL